MFFFFNDTATTEIYTLSLHDALPIYPNFANYDESKANPYPSLPDPLMLKNGKKIAKASDWWSKRRPEIVEDRSEEHTSELQSQSNLVCRLLLEKKKKKRQLRKHAGT